MDMRVSHPNSTITWTGLATLPLAIGSEHAHDTVGVVQRSKIDSLYVQRFGRHGQARLPMDDLRGGCLRPAKGQMSVASWNVEGLTDANVIELQVFMMTHNMLPGVNNVSILLHILLNIAAYV